MRSYRLVLVVGNGSVVDSFGNSCCSSYYRKGAGMNPNEMTTAEIVAELLAENEIPPNDAEYAMAYQLEQIETARSEEYERICKAG